MRLVTYRSTVESAAHLGAIDNDIVVDVARIGAAAGLALPASMLEFIDLEAVDIIATGTADRVGAGRPPQERLWPGDVVEADVGGIGRNRHPVVAA